MLREFEVRGSQYTVKEGGGYIRGAHSGRAIRDPFTNKMLWAKNPQDALALVEDSWRSAALLDILAAKRLEPVRRARTTAAAKWQRRRTIRLCAAMSTEALLQERAAAVESRPDDIPLPPHLGAVQGDATRLSRRREARRPGLSVVG